jgi:hypothetical protein
MLQNCTSAIGLVLILFSYIVFSPHTPYMGLAAILPSLGATLIIAAGRTSTTSLVGRLLSFRPVVFIGLISYSLYIWHWPIIVFHRLGFVPLDGMSPRAEKLLIYGVAILVAALSWKFIETPFRKKRFSKSFLFGAAFASLGGLSLIGGLVAKSDGMPWRFSPEVTRVASYLKYDPVGVARLNTCFIEDRYSDAGYDRSICLTQDDKKKNALLIGDSHAAHLWYGLSAAFPNMNIMQATASGCKPAVDHVLGTSETCARMMDFIYKDYLRDNKVDTLLIESAWNDIDLPLVPAVLERAKKSANHVVLFGPMLQFDESLPRLLAISILNKDPAYPYNHRLEQFRQLDEKMARLAAENGVGYVSFFHILCGATSCVTTVADGAPLLYDYGHLTKDGSLYVAEAIRANGGLP